MTNRIPTLKEFEQMGRLSIEEIHSSFSDYAATKNTDIAALTARLAEAERLLWEVTTRYHETRRHDGVFDACDFQPCKQAAAFLAASPGAGDGERRTTANT